MLFEVDVVGHVHDAVEVSLLKLSLSTDAVHILTVFDDALCNSSRNLDDRWDLIVISPIT